MRKLLLTIAVLSVSAVAAAGCGNDREAASGASELVPAGAVVYGEANLRPEGDQKEAIDSILSKFPGGGEAGDKLKDLIEKGLRESDAPISFKEDIEPWLGDEAAFFASGFGQNGQLEASRRPDRDRRRGAGAGRAREVGRGQDQGARPTRASTISTDESGEAGAVFDGFLVLGNEAGVKAAIDASKDGPTLSDDDDYKKATENAASDRLGLFYANSPEFLNVARENGTADARLLQEVLQGADRRDGRRGRRRRRVRGERPAAARAVVRVLRRGQRRARRHARRTPGSRSARRTSAS